MVMRLPRLELRSSLAMTVVLDCLKAFSVQGNRHCEPLGVAISLLFMLSVDGVSFFVVRRLPRLKLRLRLAMTVVFQAA